jgi:hypothetical protein
VCPGERGSSRDSSLLLIGGLKVIYIFKKSRQLKGTVSPDITFYFRFCKIKSVLSVRPLRVFKFFYFVVL